MAKLKTFHSLSPERPRRTCNHRRLTEEMTAEGYQPLRVQQDFIDSGGYDDAPSDWSYVQGEYQDSLTRLRRKIGMKHTPSTATLKDTRHTTCGQTTGRHACLPHDHIDGCCFPYPYLRRLVRTLRLRRFGPEYLKGGSNYEKVFKVRNALDAAADAQGSLASQMTTSNWVPS